MLKRIILIIMVAFLACNQSGYSKRHEANEAVIKQNAKASSMGVKKVDMGSSSVNDPYYNKQWIIGFTKSEAAWKIVKQKKEVRVAVVDSGVNYNHPDLKNRVLKELGYNFISNNRNVMDDLGHGTQVAGIIAAQQGNGAGISGIVGPLNVKVIPVKVLDKKGRGPSDIVAKGIVYGVNVGADIINVSIDFDEHDEYIQEALNYASTKGVLVVVAAGNSNSNCDNYSPAGDEGAYTVAAITSDYKRPYFSSYGSSVSIAAPGVDVLTTNLSGKYDEQSGTSMSAPIVAGVAAMIKAQNPSLKAQQIANLINNTATDVQAKGKDKSSGYGIINAYRAIQMAN